jgi:hypothetical protein
MYSCEQELWPQLIKYYDQLKEVHDQKCELTSLFVLSLHKQFEKHKVLLQLPVELGLY